MPEIASMCRGSETDIGIDISWLCTSVLEDLHIEMYLTYQTLSRDLSSQNRFSTLKP